MKKSELREIYLKRRNSLASDDAAEMSGRIADRFFSDFDLVTIATLHCFISIPKFNEVDTSLIFKWLWSEYPHVLTLAPRVNRESGELEHLTYTPQMDLSENSWGIREPSGTESVDAKQIDLVLVPLLCFDRRGYRVGYGKGYYDRFLRECRTDCRKVGLSFFPPIDEINDIHAGDVAIDQCITPDKVFDLNATSP